MNNFFKKLIVKLGTILQPVSESNKNIVVNNNSKVLLLVFDELEYAFATTALTNILKENTNCNITILTEGKNKIAFENNKDIDNIFIYEENKNIPKLLDGSGIDVLINTSQKQTTEIDFIISRISAKYKIGFGKNGKQYSHSISFKNNIHIVDELLKVANLFNFSFSKENVNIKFKPPIGTEQSVASFMVNNLIDTTKPLVGINISSGNENYFWGTDRFKRLIKYLSEYDVNVIILRYPIDNNKAEEIKRSNSLIFNNSSFIEYATMITELDFLFTPDSPAVQIASSQKIPMFILYKNNDKAKRWCPYNSPFELVVADADNFSRLSYGKVLNSFIPFFDNFIQDFNNLNFN